MNIGEPNNGEPMPRPERTKPKRHTAKLVPFAIRQRIINALANGDSKRAIARALHVSNNTVDVVEKEEWQQVEARKERIAAQCERNATLAADQLTERLETQKLSANQLVPVLGVSVDKMLALRGESQMTISHEHLHAHLTDEDLLEACLARKALRERGVSVDDAHLLELVLQCKAMMPRLQASTDASTSEENAEQKGRNQSLIEGITDTAARNASSS